MKFVTDAMHGRIARYLRILGYDTFYPNDISDSEILEIAKKENRIIITRDVQLSERARSRNIPFILLRSVDFTRNFHEIYKKFSLNLELDSNKSRCPVCNSEITPIPKEKIKGKVPEKTYLRFEKYWICTNKKCGKIYYEGMHWVKIRKQLEKVKNYSE
ncbi:MAG: DUF5615 family PIN-like protein [Candidatus Helarchaeota archaeon]